MASRVVFLASSSGRRISQALFTGNPAALASAAWLDASQSMIQDFFTTEHPNPARGAGVLKGTWARPTAQAARVLSAKSASSPYADCVTSYIFDCQTNIFSLVSRHFPRQAVKNEVRLWRTAMAYNRFKTGCLTKTVSKDRQHVGKFDADSAPEAPVRRCPRASHGV